MGIIWHWYIKLLGWKRDQLVDVKMLPSSKGTYHYCHVWNSLHTSPSAARWYTPLFAPLQYSWNHLSKREYHGTLRLNSTSQQLDAQGQHSKSHGVFAAQQYFLRSKTLCLGQILSLGNKCNVGLRWGFINQGAFLMDARLHIRVKKWIDAGRSIWNICTTFAL